MKIDGTYLHIRRIELGYSIKKLAGLVGLSDTMIGKYEKGVGLEAKIEIVDKLTKALNCTLIDISYTGETLQCPVCKHKIVGSLIHTNDFSYVVCNHCHYIMYFLKNNKDKEIKKNDISNS